VAALQLLKSVERDSKIETTDSYSQDYMYSQCMESFKGKPKFRFDSNIDLLSLGQFREPCFQCCYGCGLKREHGVIVCMRKVQLTEPSSVFDPKRVPWYPK